MHIPENYKFIKEKYKGIILKKTNVVGIAVGKKIKDGKDTKRPCIVILVRRKIPLDMLNIQDVVPQTLNGVETDVQESGTFKAFLDTLYISRMRPAYGGVSIGHKDITAGTFGCLVYKNGQPYILSNNHVLANTNNASPGDSILQPGPLDGGSSIDKIAALSSFVKIAFPEQESKCPIANSALSLVNSITHIIRPNYQWYLQKQTPSVNLVDAALARPIKNSDVSQEIINLGKPKGVSDASVDLKVTKSGRTTSVTAGKITMLNATVNVDYNGQPAVFENQILASAMSSPGDSGSLVMDTNNNAVGLLFAGSSQFTIMNPIKTVFGILDITLTP